MDYQQALDYLTRSPGLYTPTKKPLKRLSQPVPSTVLGSQHRPVARL